MTSITDVDRLRRRAPGERIIAYLDQSTRSNLAKGKEPALYEALTDAVSAGRLVCPVSQEHDDESILSASLHALQELGEELSMGVEFLCQQEKRRCGRALTGLELRAQGHRLLAVSDPGPKAKARSGEDGHLLAFAEAAEQLKISTSLLYKACASGRLPGVVKIGRCVRLRPAVRRSWIASFERGERGR